MAYPFVVLPSFRWLAAPVLGLLALGMGACSASSADEALSAEATGGAPGMPSATPTSLSFEPSSTLKLAPDEVKELSIVAQPPGAYRVGFALLGDPADASLDRSEAVTSPDGRASVVLTAPSETRLFSVRASVGSEVSTQLGVSVSSAGYATVEVNPAYAGSRAPPY